MHANETDSTPSVPLEIHTRSTDELAPMPVRPVVAEVTDAPAQTPAPNSPVTGFLSREQILEAVEFCFDQTGYDGVTIRAIAKQLGCSVGSIYRYFTDKRDLLRACAARVFSPVVRYVQADAVRIDESIQMYVQLAQRHAQLYRLMFWLESADEPDHPRTPETILAILDGWTSLLGDAGAARRCWAQVHGQLMLGGDLDAVEASVSLPPRPEIQIVPSLSDETETQVHVDFEGEDVTML